MKDKVLGEDPYLGSMTLVSRSVPKW